MQIGQKVIVNSGKDNEVHGIYAGTAVMQRYDSNPVVETMAIVRLSLNDSGHIQPDGGGKRNSRIYYIDNLIVRPVDITVVKE
jgi:hypothetical protein